MRIGPRFSNLVLQTLLTCIKKVPKTSKVVVIATTSNATVLESLELMDAFNVTLSVPLLGAAEVHEVLRELGVANSADVGPMISTVTAVSGIPIKKLMLVVAMSIQADKTIHPGRFAATLSETGLLAN